MLSVGVDEFHVQSLIIEKVLVRRSSTNHSDTTVRTMCSYDISKRFKRCLLDKAVH